jgi:hypothetical protein
VTLTAKVPAVIELQESTVCRVAGTVIGAMVLQRRPKSGEVVNDTVPAKPFRGVIVIVATQPFPMTQGTLVAVEGEMSKSGTGTVTVIVTFWLRAPLVPVTFTRYIPGEMLLAAVMLS